MSMIITNDVALITFVPLAIIILNKTEECVREKWILNCVAMQTVAANLGSMLTPIGNPQNLFYMVNLIVNHLIQVYWVLWN